jgi:uncharacterized damage-inducible protein DinB
MANSAAASGRDLCRAMAEAYAVNDRMNQIILEHLDPRAWQADPPGQKGRTIAAIFAHVHNIRRKWLRASAPHLKLPAPLHRARCTPKQTQAALAESAAQCCDMLGDSLANPQSRIKKFVRDGWARAWAPGAAMFAYMLTHDAHHRGQVCWIAREVGYPLPQKVKYGIWNWEKLWKECGFRNPR